MRKWLTAGAAALGLLGGSAIDARANPVIDRATAPTVGCRTRDDLMAIIRGSRLQTGDSLSDATGRAYVILRKKIADNACFAIPAGYTALLRMRDQDKVYLWGGVALMHAWDGATFYTLAPAWHYVGDAR